uniref:phage tail assembly chaperone n=1 Tax=Bradyrhizobium sp. (strain ORS 278) TaxID=114615 RepID=UPI001FCADCD0|nr:hypothetical protein [Bradyrhizobium sp. ORS 278]
MSRPTLRSDKRAEYEAELSVPPLPAELERAWHGFCRLSARRRVGLAIEPIGWADLDAFMRLTGIRLSPFEIELIEMLDDLYRKKD